MSVAAVARAPLGNTTNRPWKAGMKTTTSSPESRYASGNGVSAVRTRTNVGLGSSTTTTTTPLRRRDLSDTVSRSTGAINRNSPAEPAAPAGEPTAPASPATGNPRANNVVGGAGRELFPTSSVTSPTRRTVGGSFVTRSQTWSRSVGGVGAGRFGGLGTSSSVTALPTTNMSLDSATLGGLLNGRDNRFLIPPFRAPSRFDRETPDVFSVAAASVKESDSDSVLVGTPKASSSGETANDSPNYFTVVFDLDETLCCNRGPGRAVLRPGCLDILKSLRATSTPQRPVEIILWTASVESLARTVLVRLDPDGTIFNHLIFRDRRWFKETGYTKDLRLLGRDMDRVVIIENSPMSVTLNRQNAILVKDFMGHAPHDTDLKGVKEVLESWINSDGFLPVKTWLTQHPRIDRNNHIVAAPALNSIVGARGNGGAGATAANSPVRRGRAAPLSYGRGW